MARDICIVQYCLHLDKYSISRDICTVLYCLHINIYDIARDIFTVLFIVKLSQIWVLKIHTDLGLI